MVLNPPLLGLWFEIFQLFEHAIFVVHHSDKLLIYQRRFGLFAWSTPPLFLWKIWYYMWTRRWYHPFPIWHAF